MWGLPHPTPEITDPTLRRFMSILASATPAMLLGTGLAMDSKLRPYSTTATHTLLDGTVHTDSAAQTVSRGSLVYGNSTPKWDELVIGAASTLLKSDGTDVSWGTVSLLSAFHGDTTAGAVARGDLITGQAASPTWKKLAKGSASQFLQSDGTDLAWVSLSGDATLSAGALTIANDAVTYAKMQNVTATDKVLGRSTAGAGDVEEITCTAAGRALIDDASAAAQLVTLGAEATANKDAASGYAGLNSSSRITKGVDTTDYIIVDLATKGLVIKDAAGTPHYWLLGVTAAGALTTTDLGTTKP